MAPSSVAKNPSYPIEKGYSIHLIFLPTYISPSKGGLSLDPPVILQDRGKSHLVKEKDKVKVEIRKGTQYTIIRELRARSSLAPLAI